MNRTEGYCRLCAEMKTTTKLLDLTQESNDANDVFKKLARLKFSQLDFRENLPRTICFVCKNSLDEAYRFISFVDTAQHNLRVVCGAIKNEVHSDESCAEDAMQFDEFIPEVTLGVKHEYHNPVKPEPTVSGSKTVVIMEPEKKKTTKRKQKSWSLDDSLPLNDIKLSWESYPWRCAVCEVEFYSSKELVCHSMLVHKLCTTFRCVDCKTRKLKIEKFIKHVKRHRNHLKTACYLCLKQFKSASLLTHHMKEHNTNFSCIGCGTSFETVEDLNNHEQQFYTDKRANRIKVKSEKVGDPICTICDKAFINHSKLATHMRIHDTNRKTYICDKCGKPYFHKVSLQEHMMLHDNIKPHQCKICNISFLSLARLKLHVSTHESAKPYPCSVCGKLFRTKRQVQNHMIVHSDILPFSCIYCNKQFKFKSRLNQHLIQHTGIKPYSCSVCERTFTNWPNYNKHMKRRHDMNMAKKQHTPDGVMPINPLTGKVQYIDAKEAEDFKKSILALKRKRGPVPTSNSNTEIVTENALTQDL